MRRAYLWVFWVILSLGWSQQTPPVKLDFFADLGGCEIDFDKDGRVDGLSVNFAEGLEPSAIELSLDNQVRFAGSASQRVRLQKGDGSTGGRFYLFESINPNLALVPQEGEPLRVQVALRAEGFQNATYSVYVRTGERRVILLNHTDQMTGGWQTLSAVVPVERRASGEFRFSLEVEIRAGQGSASGTLWVDEIRALSSRTVSRFERFPIGLKSVHTYLLPNRDGYRYLDGLPVGVIIGSSRDASIIRRHFPEAMWAPYTIAFAALNSPGYTHNADLYEYNDLDQNHPDWFLLDQNGQRIINPAEPHEFYVDIGRTEVRERAWQRLRDFMYRAGKPNLVYLDNVDMLVGPNRFNPPSYPTNDLWVQAVVGWFQYVGSRAQQEFGSDFGFIPNVAWAPGFWNRGIPGVSQDAPGVPTLPYVKGFLLEHFGVKAESDREGRTSAQNYGTATGTNGPQAWNRRLLRDSIRLVTENPDKISILMPTFWVGNYEGLPNNTERLRYAIGLCLIVNHDNVFVQLDPRRQQDQYPNGFFPPELYTPLGKPTGNYRIQNGDLISGGLFIRDYENGMVLVNPTPNRDFIFTVPRDLYDWDRNLIRAGTEVTIARQTALVLWSAPEITLSISQDKTQVLPSETVQFTVTYRNTGTAPGTNVKIAVPLPEGMTLIGSNPTARVEDGQVVWTVSNIPVNGTGTLRFTVRVE